MLHEKSNIKGIGPIESRALIKIFNKLSEKIEWIDKLIYKIAVTYSCNCSSAMEIYDEIITQMKRKKMILDIQEIVKSSVEKLKSNERGLLHYLLKYPQIHICNLCEILNIGSRSLYRCLNNAYEHLSIILSPYSLKINQFFNKEKWAADVCDSLKQKQETITD